MTFACRALTAQGAQLAIGAPGSPYQRRGADLPSGVVTRRAGAGMVARCHAGEPSTTRDAGPLLPPWSLPSTAAIIGACSGPVFRRNYGLHAA
jgi:hypothetical protein